MMNDGEGSCLIKHANKIKHNTNKTVLAQEQIVNSKNREERNGYT